MSTATVSHALEAISRYLEDKNAVEIMVTRPGELLIEKKNGEWKRELVPSTNIIWWRNVAHAVSIASGQSFNERLPLLNPIGAVWTAAMMLEHLGEGAAAKTLEGSIETCLASIDSKTRDLGGSADT